VSKESQKLVLLIIMALWCFVLIVGSAGVGFIGMLFAGEPGSGAEVTASEYLQLGAPLFASTALTIALTTLWVKQYYRVAALVFVASIALILGVYAFIFHGFVG
jgi:ABC-type transport system involved in multi-copper enzyme maturation permease subunit